ncbi:MAG: HD domain-containing protein [Oceanisphaera sp.]|uniref:HD domain-containing protein n=1 Tax=Oceanisphaera sp. TaxID=1929979 RepID=UPI003C7157AD
MTLMKMDQSYLNFFWANKLFDDGNMAQWQFCSMEQQFSISLAHREMQGVCSEGQWVLTDVYGEYERLQLGTVRPLPMSVTREQLERQLAWLPNSQQLMLADVWSMLMVITDKALNDFLLSVLTDDSIMVPFAQGRASHRHHHDKEGGLLAHSHEVAMTAAMLTNQHGLGRRSIWVAFVGGLLHDIGKIRLYYNEIHGSCSQHESLSFMVLGKSLDRLRLASPKVFEAITACLAVKVGRYTDPYQVANIVRMCDRLSAEVCNWKSAFSKAPNYYWYARSPRDNQIYKRLC